MHGGPPRQSHDLDTIFEIDDQTVRLGAAGSVTVGLAATDTVDCDDGDSVSGSIGNVERRTATFRLVPGENQTCTFQHGAG